MKYFRFLLNVFVFLLVSYQSNADNYFVTGVSSDDILNVRNEATSKSDVVGVLAFDANNIVLTGKHIQQGKSLWVEIKHKDITAWVIKQYLAEQGRSIQNSSTSGIANLTCNGSEPDWFLKLDVHKKIIEFESLSFAKQTFLPQAIKASKNNTNQWFVTADAVQGKEKLNISLIETHQCSDDMSDFVYRYSMLINTVSHGAYSGCCNREK